tara:strand:+ start:357 stop:974 length:618 start_codon:yes stop_codon:yes gene_type:complete
MYNCDFVLFPFETVYFYENLQAYTTLPTSTYWIVLKVTGRNNNYQRSCIARDQPSPDYTSPSYTTTDRYVKFGINCWIPRWDNLAGSIDTSANKYVGNIETPTKQIYDVKVYIATTRTIDTDHADVTLIPEIKPVLYTTDENRDIVTNAANWADYLNPAFVTYNSYTTNDLTEVEMTSLGKPASASVDNRDVEYGVQTWTPNYTN